MIIGTVSLYDRAGSFLDSRYYEGNYERKQIFKKWRLLYAEKLNNCFIQYAPHVSDKVDETGNNVKK